MAPKLRFIVELLIDIATTLPRLVSTTIDVAWPIFDGASDDSIVEAVAKNTVSLGDSKLEWLPMMLIVVAAAQRDMTLGIPSIGSLKHGCLSLRAD
jgi:hypothetical protein